MSEKISLDSSVQKYKIQLPSEEEFKRFLSKEIG